MLVHTPQTQRAGLGFKFPRNNSKLEIHPSLLTRMQCLLCSEDTRGLGLACQALGVSTAAEKPGAAAGWDPDFIGRGAPAPGRKPRMCSQSKESPAGPSPTPIITKHAWKVFKTHPSYKIHEAEPSAWQPGLIPAPHWIFPAEWHKAASPLP